MYLSVYVRKSCLRKRRSAFLVRHLLSTLGILLRLAVFMLISIRWRPFVHGQSPLPSKSCSNFWVLQIIMHNIFIIMPTLLHHLLTSSVPSILGTGVVLRITHLTSCESYYITHQSYTCLTLSCPLSLIRMHIMMQLVLCCCSMMVVYTPWHIVAASTLRQNATMGVVRKNC